MNAIVKSLIAASIVASFSMNAYADEREKGSREQRRDDFKQMQPSERGDMRHKMRRERDEDDSHDRNERREEMRERFEHMSPHERREMREEMRHRSYHNHSRHERVSASNHGRAVIVLGPHQPVIERVEFKIGF